jgi:hypothetical protein
MIINGLHPTLSETTLPRLITFSGRA